MLTEIGNDMEKAANLLREGAAVAIPTETVYGLAANALNDDAVLKIFEAKNRPSFNPLIVHVKNWEDAERYLENVPAKARRLASVFTPGPLTFLLPKKKNIPDLVTAGSNRVAIRIPAHPMALALLQSLDFPLAAPSANPFGYISPTTAQHVFEGLQGKIPYILDGGATTVGLESTIIGFDEKESVLLFREGGVSKEQLEEVLHEKIIRARPDKEAQPATAGQLKSHYAPHKPLYAGNVEELHKKFPGKKIAVISFRNRYEWAAVQYVLSAAGSLPEAAKHLFAAMREADKSDAELVLAERFPAEGLGLAINDRLSRAQAENKQSSNH